MEITVHDNWDGTQTLLLDGEVVLERKPKGEVEEKANVLRMALLLPRLDKPTP